jgi:hypothetical protein
MATKNRYIPHVYNGRNDASIEQNGTAVKVQVSLQHHSMNASHQWHVECTTEGQVKLENTQVTEQRNAEHEKAGVNRWEQRQ